MTEQTEKKGASLKNFRVFRYFRLFRTLLIASTTHENIAISLTLPERVNLKQILQRELNLPLRACAVVGRASDRADG